MIDPNAPAFPRESSPTAYGTTGVTTRTYLAGLAMQGMLANPSLIDGDGLPWIAEHAVKMADHFITALNKSTT